MSRDAVITIVIAALIIASFAVVAVAGLRSDNAAIVSGSTGTPTPAACPAPTPPPETSSGTTERVSGGTGGTQADSSSHDPTITPDGRFIAFWSFASNLVPGDTNGVSDVFLQDRQVGTTERISVGNGGVQANSASDFLAGISADGRYVSFRSLASNLVASDTNSLSDTFVRDRFTAVTERVSVASDGTQANGSSGNGPMSADGRYVAFSSSATNLVANDTNGAFDIFVKDRQTGAVQRVSLATDTTEANANSSLPDISSDGQFVAFRFSASNLVASDTNGVDDIFVHDRQTGITERVSIDTGGMQFTTYSFLGVDQRRRPVRGVRNRRRLRSRSASRDNPARERGERRHPGKLRW
jgi:Tol biopolymer transport system component